MCVCVPSSASTRVEVKGKLTTYQLHSIFLLAGQAVVTRLVIHGLGARLSIFYGRLVVCQAGWRPMSYEPPPPFIRNL